MFTTGMIIIGSLWGVVTASLLGLLGWAAAADGREARAGARQSAATVAGGRPPSLLSGDAPGSEV